MHVRGRENVLKRVLIHLGGFNLSLVMRQGLGKGTPRGWQGYSAEAVLVLLRWWIAVVGRIAQQIVSQTPPTSAHATRVEIFVLPAAK